MVSIAAPARAPRLRRRALAACATLFLLLGAGSTTAGAASADSSSNGSLLPGDPFQSKQWYLSWQDRPGSPSTGKGASVGIIDTGVDASHPELAAAYDSANSKSFLSGGSCNGDTACDDPGHDGFGHGTSVAGIVAAAVDGHGIVGAAPGARIVSLKAGDRTGTFSADAVSQAIRYGADAHLSVLVMSFTVDPWFRYCDNAPADTAEQRAQQKTDLEKVTSALKYAADHGVVLVAAAGNEAYDLDHGTSDPYSSGWSGQGVRPVTDQCVTRPAQSSDVTTVGAITEKGARSSYSNVGAALDIVTFGGEPPLAGPGDAVLQGPESGILTTVSADRLRQAGALNDDGSPRTDEVLSDCPSGGGSCRYYWYQSGTSYAAPQVAAAAAELRSRGVPAGDVKKQLTTSATPISCPSEKQALACEPITGGGNTWYGAGALRLPR